MKLTKNIIAEDLDSVSYITNENGDTAVTVSNLMTMLKVTPQYSDDITKQIFDLMGLDMPKQNMQVQQQGQPIQGDQQAIKPQSLQNITTNANVQ